jgi:C_GCAxxG_C_C family probable redox protein
MLARLLKPRKFAIAGANAREDAGRLFAGGQNCAQAVFEATTGRNDPEILKMAEAFGGGIGGSKCLCGAVTGGVMALSLCGKGAKANELVLAFREKFGMTCCSALSRPYKWKSREHLANCRIITEETAQLVANLLGR